MEDMQGMVQKPKPKRQLLREQARDEAMKQLLKTDLPFREASKSIVVFNIKTDEGRLCKATWYMTKGRLMINAERFDQMMTNDEIIEWLCDHIVREV